jgi:hypothetical protein
MQKDLTFWGEHNINQCVTHIANGNSVDQQAESLLTVLRAIESGEHRPTGEELLRLANFFAILCLGRIIEDGISALQVPEVAEAADEANVSSDDPILTRFMAPKLVGVVQAAHGELRWVDMRIGFEFGLGKWDPQSPSEVLLATFGQIERAVNKAAAEVVEWATTQP